MEVIEPSVGEILGVGWRRLLCLPMYYSIFKKKPAYEMPKCLEFRRVLFRSNDTATTEIYPLALLRAGGVTHRRQRLGRRGATRLEAQHAVSARGVTTTGGPPATCIRSAGALVEIGRASWRGRA